MGASSSSGNTKPTTDYTRLDTGVYAARCIQVVELGTHDNEYKGEVKKRKELILVFEVSGELMEDGRPFVVSWRGTNSLNEKGKLFSLLAAWRYGKPFSPDELMRFELKKLLDQSCMVNVTKETSKTGKEYNRVMSVVPMPKGMILEARQNELVDFGICDLGTPEFDKLYGWVQKIVMDSDEGKRFNASGAPMTDDKEPLPF